MFHYAQTLFEGMKAYRDENGKVTLFRPDMNMKRMQTSAKRIALPVSPVSKDIANGADGVLSQTFNGDALLELIKELIRMDKHWIPQEPGHSLYVRPTLSKFRESPFIYHNAANPPLYCLSWSNTRHFAGAGEPVIFLSPFDWMMSA